MKTSLFVVSAVLLLGSFHSALAADAKSIEANCYYTGPTWASTGSFGTGSAVSTDKVFAAQKGLISLEAKQVSRRGGFSELRYTVWEKTQTLQLGYGYALILNLRYQNQTPAGDFVVDTQKLETSSIVTYKGQAITSAAVTSSAVETDREGVKVLNVEMQMDNLPLRVLLGKTANPEVKLTEAMRDSADRTAIYKNLGNGDGVILNANVICSVPVQ